MAHVAAGKFWPRELSVPYGYGPPDFFLENEVPCGV